METEFWISQLGRLYREAHGHVGSGGEGARPLANQFNEVLSNLKDDFPDNDFVQSTEEVSPGRLGSAGGVTQRQDAAAEVRMKCGQLADAIGYDLPEEELRQQDAPMNVVKVQSHQTTEQNIEQTISIDATFELINNLPRDQETADELRELVNEFNEELESDDTEASKLREVIERAKEKSPEVAANLGMIALQKGIIGILGF